MKNKLNVLLGAACIIIALNAQPAHAQLVVFPDRASFDTTFSGANVENWDEYNPNTVLSNGTTTNGITYQTNSSNSALVTNNWLTSTGANGLGEQGITYFNTSDTITFTFAQPLNAFGIDINTYTDKLVGDYTATLSNGSVIDSYPDSFPFNSTGEFIGLSDSTSFNSVTITDTSSESYTLDTLRYVYAPQSSSVVPEPSTVGLMFVGLIAIAVFTIRRRVVQSQGVKS